MYMYTNVYTYIHTHVTYRYIIGSGNRVGGRAVESSRLWTPWMRGLLDECMDA